MQKKYENSVQIEKKLRARKKYKAGKIDRNKLRGEKKGRKR